MVWRLLRRSTSTVNLKDSWRSLVPLLGPNVARLKKKGDAEGLARALQHKNAEIRVEAADALGSLVDGRAWELLLEAIGHGVEEDVVHTAEARILRAVRGLGFGDRPDDRLKARAAKTLEEIGEPAVPFLIGALGEFNTRIQKAATRILGRIPGPGASDALIGALSSPAAVVKENAARALGERGDRRAVRPLVAMLQSERADIRRHVVRALQQIGGVEAEETLKRLGPEPRLMAMFEDLQGLKAVEASMSPWAPANEARREALTKSLMSIDRRGRQSGQVTLVPSPTPFMR